MNSLILIIDTAHPTARVILADAEKILAERQWANTPKVGTDLLVYIEEVQKEAGIDTASITRIGVHAGPGSYGLVRIGITTGTVFAQAVGAKLLVVEGETVEELVDSARKATPVHVIEPKYA